MLLMGFRYILMLMVVDILCSERCGDIPAILLRRNMGRFLAGGFLEALVEAVPPPNQVPELLLDRFGR